jgi:hypothetical protein
MLRRLSVLVVLLASCSRQADQPQVPTPEEVAHSRGARVPDQIDSLIASVVGMDAEFGDGGTDSPTFYFSGQSDTAFKRLAVIPAAVPRLIECLGWDRRSRTTWNGAPVLVGAVCGHVLLFTPYVRKRNYSHPWVEHRDPTIDRLRALQLLWLSQLRRDPG